METVGERTRSRHDATVGTDCHVQRRKHFRSGRGGRAYTHVDLSCVKTNALLEKKSIELLILNCNK